MSNTSRLGRGARSPNTSPHRRGLVNTTNNSRVQSPIRRYMVRRVRSDDDNGIDPDSGANRKHGVVLALKALLAFDRSINLHALSVLIAKLTKELDKAHWTDDLHRVTIAKALAVLGQGAALDSSAASDNQRQFAKLFSRSRQIQLSGQSIHEIIDNYVDEVFRRSVPIDEDDGEMETEDELIHTEPEQQVEDASESNVEESQAENRREKRVARKRPRQRRVRFASEALETTDDEQQPRAKRAKRPDREFNELADAFFSKLNVRATPIAPIARHESATSTRSRINTSVDQYGQYLAALESELVEKERLLAIAERDLGKANVDVDVKRANVLFSMFQLGMTVNKVGEKTGTTYIQVYRKYNMHAISPKQLYNLVRFATVLDAHPMLRCVLTATDANYNPLRPLIRAPRRSVCLCEGAALTQIFESDQKREQFMEKLKIATADWLQMCAENQSGEAYLQILTDEQIVFKSVSDWLEVTRVMQ